jgi:hypothetical protein
MSPIATPRELAGGLTGAYWRVRVAKPTPESAASIALGYGSVSKRASTAREGEVDLDFDFAFYCWGPTAYCHQFARRSFRIGDRQSAASSISGVRLVRRIHGVSVATDTTVGKVD